ncbi:MAG: hypothetical protein ACI8XC_004633, partial [Gammaproteobacteria bacterium]
MILGYSVVTDLSGSIAIILRKIIELHLSVILVCVAGPGLADALENCNQKQYNAEVVPLNMSVAEKKQRFRCLVQPAIESTYQALYQQYREV